MGLTFQHILKTLQHISKTLQHISLFNTFFNQNAKKYLYNTFKKKIRFVCLKVKFPTFSPSLGLITLKNKI